MKLYLNVTYGQDVPAYYTHDVEVDLPDGLFANPARPSASELAQPEVVAAAIAAAKAAANDASRNGEFDPSWEVATGLRITQITENTTDEEIANDIALQASGEDLGLVAKHVLQGIAQPHALLFEAERQGIEVCDAVRKMLSPPSSGH